MKQTTEHKNSNDSKPGTQSPKRPNETGSISVEAFVRISDPETKEIFVEQRA